MKTIEVEWKVNVKSGLTTIDLTDMNIDSITEWKMLSRADQEKSINEYLANSESYIRAVVTDW
jgi:hypothetical protein